MTFHFSPRLFKSPYQHSISNMLFVTPINPPYHQSPSYRFFFIHRGHRQTDTHQSAFSRNTIKNAFMAFMSFYLQFTDSVYTVGLHNSQTTRAHCYLKMLNEIKTSKTYNLQKCIHVRQHNKTRTNICCHNDNNYVRILKMLCVPFSHAILQ